MPDDTSYSARTGDSPVDYVPRRVVSLVPSLTESLFDLDLGNRLIAISDHCTRPTDRARALRRVGGVRQPDIAQIVELGPDLVLLDADINRPADVAALREAGIPVWITGPRTVFDTLNLLWDIMHIFDHAVMVPRVREIERAYDYTQGAARIAEPVRVFAALGCDPWVTVNTNTYTHDLLRVCGGANVFANHAERYPTVTLDAVIAAQPDVILLPGDCPVPESGIERVHRIDGSQLTWYGTRLGYALRDLPGLLMPEGGSA
ncbi:MAG: ABC transporter substrate-binding protein [Anaerolineae bacterium]|nr:ABC transporter substrate-binding protein [Anaerolineae bacterium]